MRNLKNFSCLFTYMRNLHMQFNHLMLFIREERTNVAQSMKKPKFEFLIP